MSASGRRHDRTSAPGERPWADAETAVLLFEPGTVINTGDAGGELTAEVQELA